jgi:hypothetical protein
VKIITSGADNPSARRSCYSLGGHHHSQLPSVYVAQLRRRTEAAARSVPLDCGCRDPILCDCSQPPLSDPVVNGWRDSALHILDTGQTPVLPIEVLRCLYRRGGADRRLAELLHRAAGGAAA